MGKRKLCAGIVIGSIIGGLVTMADPRVRAYTKKKITTIKTKSAEIIKNPSETVHKVRTSFDQLNEKLTKGTERAIYTLETVEKSLQKLSKKE
ncbi:MAG TPA: YtxH domain-containing protein [Bacillota bacterium]|nr:YtxH domain-containing protein [Bacillota bacterium]